MKLSPRFSRPLVLLTAAGLTAALSSCHRGMGCPTNFSVNDFLDGLVAVVKLF